jgi:hypothetical protein
MSNKHAPYAGQGRRLPEYLGKGSWVIENLVYLSLDDKETAAPPSTGKIDSGGVLTSLTGRHAIKFGAAGVAAAMGIPVEELMEANRKGLLLLTNAVVPPKPGTEKAMRFRLEYQETRFEITLDLSRAGNV